MLKDFLFTLIIVSIILAVLMGMLEAYLWLRQTNEHERLAERYADRALCMRASADPRLVYEYVPERCNMNAEGFPDRNHKLAKPANTLRVVLIGDSVAQGHRVAREQRFGNLIEQTFGGAVEVINLARTGYSTGQELIVLENYGLKYKPDLILWSYVLNDPAHPFYHNVNAETGRFFFQPSWRGLAYIQRKVFEAREHFRARDCSTEFHAFLHCAYRPEIAAQLDELGAISRQHQIPVLFFVIPVMLEGDTFSAYSLQWVHDDLNNLAQNAGLLVADPLAAFHGYDVADINPPSTDWYDPWHPNALGHQLIAKPLIERLHPFIERR